MPGVTTAYIIEHMMDDYVTALGDAGMRHPYDPIEGFTPITLLTRSQGFGLIVPGDSRFKTLDQFLAAARADPPAQFAAYIASEIERYKKVLPPLGNQID